MLDLPRKHTLYRAAVRQAALLCCALVSVAALSSEELSQTRHITGVRFWTLGDVTRITVEADGEFRVRSDRLQNPDRLFFDLIGTKPSVGPKGTTVIPVADRLLRQIRVAETQHNVTRVVLDMEGPWEATTSRLDNPDRLIIELRSPGPVVTPKPTEVEGMASKVESLRPPVPERRTFAPPPAPVMELYPKRQQQTAVLEPPPAVTQSQLAMPSLAASMNSRISPGAVRPAPVSTLAKASAPPITAIIPPPLENALPARRNASGDRSMIRVLGLKVGRIVIDAGHGGHDVGTTGPDGLREKDLVLDVAKRLGALIEERMGSEVVYTRADDTFIPLERRTEIANEAKADLFLSIHANSSTLGTAAGVETYYLNFTTSKAALELAARENSGAQKSIFELQDLLQKIALKDKVEESREFASRIQSSIYSASLKTDAHARDRGVRKAPFVVLIGASMPSVLSEIGFISNAHDETIMKRGEYRQRMAEALYKGVASYASTLSHFQVAQRH